MRLPLDQKKKVSDLPPDRRQFPPWASQHSPASSTCSTRQGRSDTSADKGTRESGPATPEWEAQTKRRFRVGGRVSQTRDHQNWWVFSSPSLELPTQKRCRNTTAAPNAHREPRALPGSAQRRVAPLALALHLTGSELGWRRSGLGKGEPAEENQETKRPKGEQPDKNQEKHKRRPTQLSALLQLVWIGWFGG